jgi:hypothetical protein
MPLMTQLLPAILMPKSLMAVRVLLPLVLSMRPVDPRKFRYSCRFAGVLRRSPEPPWAVRAFADCLIRAHSFSTFAS